MSADQISDAEHGEQVRARLAAATPGPWYWCNGGGREPVLLGARTRCVMAFRRFGMNYAQPLFPVDGILTDTAKANLHDFPNAELIAHAPDDLARLLARAEAAEAALARVEALCVEWDALDPFSAADAREVRAAVGGVE